MKLISAVMLLLQTAACVDRFCSFDQSDPCNAAVGDTLKIMIPHTRIYDVKIQKIIHSPRYDPVCRIKNNTIRMSECDLYNERAEVMVRNGALIIKPVTRADSGTYRFTVMNSEGIQIPTADLQVNVEGSLVSMVFVLVWCLQMMLLLGLLGGFHLYMRHMSGNKEEDQELSVRRFREGHDDS